MKGQDQGARRVRLAPLCIWYMRPVYEGLGMRVSDVRVGQNECLAHLRSFSVGVNVLSATLKGSRLRCIRLSCSNLEQHKRH